MDSAGSNLEQIRTLTSQSQAEIGEMLRRTVSSLGEQVLRAVEEVKRLVGPEPRTDSSMRREPGSLGRRVPQ